MFVSTMIPSSKTWDRDQIIKLIKLYEKHEELWDVKNDNYKDKGKRQQSIYNIAEELDFRPDEISRKLNSLLASYRREKNIILNAASKGNDSKVPWWGFKYFGFLIKEQFGEGFKPEDQANAEEGNNTPTPKKIELQYDVIDENTQEEENYHYVNVDNETENGIELENPFSSTVENFDSTHDSKRKRGKKRSYAQESFDSRDEIKVFTELMDWRLRKIRDAKKLCVLKHKIENLLFEAEMDDFESRSKEWDIIIKDEDVLH